MPQISRSSGLVPVKGIPYITVRKIGEEEARQGVPQQVLVKVPPYATIPLHRHGVNAEMVVLKGSAWVLSRDGTNGQSVGSGDRVFFEAGADHGFRAGKKGMWFLSINDGIVDEHGESDLQFAAA